MYVLIKPDYSKEQIRLTEHPSDLIRRKGTTLPSVLGEPLIRIDPDWRFKC